MQGYWMMRIALERYVDYAMKVKERGEVGNDLLRAEVECCG